MPLNAPYRAIIKREGKHPIKSISLPHDILKPILE